MSDNGSPQITIVVDGIEISAPEGQMLVDSAKHGDIEIPVFCYEPKLGDPVGACRMCLVEIEGMPKLQTACSTPIRDGMVIYTQNERVSEAQNAVVEFLLVNHPLDCPVCDKGGECPLQDIAMGWGPGKSRFTDPKRHFQKPIPLSPLVKIDRERCILCYRCVRFSQEVAEDEQLQLIERGPKTYVGTHDDRPYVAPFHGNIIELCPVGALTSQSYRFRARPWEIEQAGSVCTLCPSQCNVKYSVRDEGVARVLARDNEEVDDGWLCDKGRFGYQMFTSPDRPTGAQLRSGGALEPVRWDEAIERGAEGLGAAKGKVAALVGGGASNEEAYLIQRMVRGPLASTDVSSSRRGALAASTRRALADPKLAVTTRQLDDADAIVVIGADPMHEMPILELRIRKAVRRNATDLVIATERPTSLDGGAAIGTSGPLEAHRYEPGAAAEFLEGLVRSISGDGDDGTGIAEALDGKERVVIVWGERVLEADGERTAAALLELASSLGLAEVAGAGLYEIPIDANGRGVRESGACENAGPGLADLAGGRTSDEIRDALEAGELEALILWDVDPVRDFDDPEAWSRAIGAANFTLSSSMFGNASEQNSDLHFPAETHAEKEGTVTHPDGRLQRVRPSVPRPGNNRPLWQVLTELSAALGDETGAETSGEVFELLASESPLYRGMTHDTIGGFGVRWQDINPSALSTGVGGKGSADPGRPDGVVSGEAHEPPSGRSAEPSPPTYDAPGESSEDTRGARTSDGPSPDPAAADDSGIRLGTYPDLWADYVAERNEALRFLSPSQTVEINVQLAKELGLGNGQTVNVVAPSGKSVRASVAI
ncbi:MAG: NADH-quinone oxidoreductase subunit NuoG, partial [Solirubrobacterales bacterium]